MRVILDAHPEFARWVQADLLAGGVDPDHGRDGMSGELRALVIKQANGFSYEQLAFHLADSQSYRAFCLIGFADKPRKKSTLQRNIKLVRPETLERVNRSLVRYAHEQGIEDGKRLRSDATVIEAAIHEPTDSSLLVDCVRVLTRHLREAREYVALTYINHHRRAKRRALAILHSAKAEQRVPLYRDLAKVAENTVKSARFAVEKLEDHYPAEAFQQPELGALRDALKDPGGDGWVACACLVRWHARSGGRDQSHATLRGERTWSLAVCARAPVTHPSRESSIEPA